MKVPSVQSLYMLKILSRGYPGIHKLRASCKTPLMIRTAKALGCTESEVSQKWRLLPPRYFWPTVREWAKRLGVPNVDAFVYLVGLTPDPARPIPHPLLGPR